MIKAQVIEGVMGGKKIHMHLVPAIYKGHPVWKMTRWSLCWETGDVDKTVGLVFMSKNTVAAD